MRKLAAFFVIAFAATGLSSSAYAASGCGDMTVCVKNPPFPPSPPLCKTYPNYCSFVQPNVSLFEKFQLPKTELQSGEKPAPKAEAPSGPGYSIQLDNLTKEQLQAVLDALGVSKGKVEVPQ